jgi:hypothetical protein
MASTVYSNRLFQALALMASASFTVPAGFKAVLRDVDVFVYGSTTGQAFSIVGPIGQIIWNLNIGGPSNGSWHQWSGRQVFGPGEQVFFEATAPGTDVTASGYLLQLP